MQNLGEKNNDIKWISFGTYHQHITKNVRYGFRMIGSKIGDHHIRYGFRYGSLTDMSDINSECTYGNEELAGSKSETHALRSPKHHRLLGHLFTSGFLVCAPHQ